jgi:RNA-directed DNA polymerase
MQALKEAKTARDKTHILYNISRTPILRQIKLKGNSSPDDPSLREYWQKRATDYGKKYWSKGSKYEAIARLQNWKCPECGDRLFNGEPIETHHILPVAEGGSDDSENLKHLHKTCHKQVHSKTK